MKIAALFTTVAALALSASAATPESDMLFVRALGEHDAARRGEALLALAERREHPSELALVYLTRVKLPPKSLARLLPVARSRFGELVPTVLLTRAFRAEESEAVPEPMARDELFDLVHTAWKNSAGRELSPFEARLFRELSGQLLELAWECGKTAQVFPLVEKRIDARGSGKWSNDFPVAALLEFCYRHAFVAEGFELYSPEWAESPSPGRRAFAALLAESAKLPPRGDDDAMKRIQFLLGADLGEMALLLAAERLDGSGQGAVFGRRLQQLIYAMVVSGRHEIFANVRPLLDPKSAPMFEAMTLANGGKPREALALLPRIADKAERARIEFDCRMALGEFDRAAAMVGSPDFPASADDRVVKLLTIAELRRDAASYLAAKKIAGKLADEDISLANAFGYTALLLGRDRAEAEKRIARSLSLRPRESAYLDSMAWARYCAGDYAGAWKYMEASLRYCSPQFDNCELFEHAAAIRLALGDRDGARRCCEVALKLAEAGERSRRRGWLFRKRAADIRKLLEQLK